MLAVTSFNLLSIRGIDFPVVLWLPWILYLVVYLIYDYSFLGFQLTLQYTLPLLIGIAAAGFTYTADDFEWIFRWFIRLVAFVYSLFVIANLFGNGYPPSMSMMPMLFSVAMSLIMGMFYMTGRTRNLFYVALLFLAPVVELTKMGIVATSAVFIFHFANNSLKSKALYGLAGFSILLMVFYSNPFQKAFFYEGKGDIKDLTINYYDNPNVINSGRITWKKALDPGLEAAPLWGNGPRADNAVLAAVTGLKAGEAHNDYLSVRYNYGYAGLALLLLGFAATFISLYRISRQYMADDTIWLVSTSALTLFITFLLFMYTDNILKYTIYFPNYFFAMIGIVYSLKRDEDISSDPALQ
jgi:hypothetical protein